MSPAGGVVQKLNVGFTGGPSVNAGFDYQLVGNWFFNFDVKQIFMRMHGWANDSGSPTFIKAHDALNPTLVAAGIELSVLNAKPLSPTRSHVALKVAARFSGPFLRSTWHVGVAP